MSDDATNDDPYQPKEGMTDAELRDALLNRLIEAADQNPAWIRIIKLEVDKDHVVTGHLVDRFGNLLTNTAVFITCRQGDKPLEVGTVLKLWRDGEGKAHLDGCLL